MKRATLILFVFVLALSASAVSYAKDDAKGAQDIAKQKAALRKKIADRKEELNGSEWVTTLNSSEKNEKPESDTLTFQNNTVASKFFMSKGFSATNYTVTLPEGSAKGVWETMQTSSNSKEGVVFIHGEWEKESMNGQVTQQLGEGKTKEYYFTTSARKAILPPVPQKGVKGDETPSSVSAKNAVRNPLSALVSKEQAPPSDVKK